jgi:arabinofuranosyltransferase
VTASGAPNGLTDRGKSRSCERTEARRGKIRDVSDRGATKVRDANPRLPDGSQAVRCSSKPEQSRNFAEPLFLGLALLSLVALARYHWQHVADDAFIAFRYARNAVAGQGLVWNPGEAVEGYSSPLWLGVLALGQALGAPLPAWAGGCGLVCLALALFFVHRSCLVLSESRVAAAAACLASALIYPLAYWAEAGLETALVAVLMTGAVWSLLRGSPGWAVFAALLGIARPEGLLLVPALAGAAALASGQGALRPRQLALAFLPMLGWLLFRRIYYHDWFPNPYYAKATGALLQRIEAGLLYSTWALILGLVTVAATWLAGALDRKTGAALAFLAAGVVAVIVEGGDWMWHARLLAPLLPALVVLAAAAVAKASSPRRWSALVTCILSWSAFAPRASVAIDALSGGRMPSSLFQEGTLAEVSESAAAFIASRYPNDALVAVNHAGALPYALPNPAIDMTGLCDWHIAHEREGGVHHKFDAAYVLARKPALVVLNSATKPGTDGTWYHKGYWEGETALVNQPEWADLYRPVDVCWPWRSFADVPRYLLLYERATAGN